MTQHKMGQSRLNHGNTQCIYCLATDLEILHALGPVCPKAPVTAVERWLDKNTTKPDGRTVERLLWHVEQCLGPISRETCEVAGDDDYSILKHNFECVLATRTANDADYNARIDRACSIPNGDDWNARFLQALDDEGLMLSIGWNGTNDQRYPWPGTPIPAPFPYASAGPTWPRNAYIVYKP